MKILQLSKDDGRGGAAIAAYRLHTALINAGIDSTMLVESKYTSNPNVFAFNPPNDLVSRIKRKIFRYLSDREFRRYKYSRPEGLEAFSTTGTQFGNSWLGEISSVDIINIHYISGFIDWMSLKQLQRNIKIVWTLHDMNFFTGGCHYDLGCGKYKNHCGCCPQLGSQVNNDLSYINWKNKMNIISYIGRDRIRIITNSKCLAKEAASSPILNGIDIDTIHYGIDTELFRPKYPEIIKKALGLSPESKVIIFIADYINNKRKGADIFIEAMNKVMKNHELHVLTIGNGKIKLGNGVRHTHLGFVESEILLSLIYCAADITVVPSLQEAFGQTALESISCGTPVVAFKVGGIPEFIIPEISGWLSDNSVNSLAETIETAFEDIEKGNNLRKSCREFAIKNFDSQIQVERYIELYNSLLN